MITASWRTHLERGSRWTQFAAVLALLAAAVVAGPARADDGFPFGMEMTLDVGRQPGSKRMPTLEIGDNGEVVLELWCKGGKGQFSVAGNTVIFVAGAMEDRDLSAGPGAGRR